MRLGVSISIDIGVLPSLYFEQMIVRPREVAMDELGWLNARVASMSDRGSLVTAGIAQRAQ